MDTFVRFLYEFLEQFILGFKLIVAGIGKGINEIFNITAYREVLETYKNDLSFPEWGLVINAIIVLLIFIGLLIS